MPEPSGVGERFVAQEGPARLLPIKLSIAKRRRDPIRGVSKRRPKQLEAHKVPKFLSDYLYPASESAISSESYASSGLLGQFSRSVSVPPSLQDPSSFGNTERILRLVQGYIRGSFDSQIWPLVPSLANSHTRPGMVEPRVTALNNFYSLFISAHRMMRVPNPKFADIAVLVNKGNDAFKEVLREQHHNTLLQLFQVIVGFLTANVAVRDMLRMTLVFFVDLALIVMGDHHPLTEISRALASCEQSILTDTIARAWEVLASSFSEKLGADHHVTLNCQLKMIESVFVRSATFDKAEGLLYDLRATSVATRGFKDIQSMSIEHSLARLYVLQGRYLEGIDKASEVLTYCNDFLTEDKHAAAALQSSAVCLMASSKFQMGQYDTAEACLRQYVQVRSSTWGWQSTLTLHALLSLEEFLVATKKEQEAFQIKQQRLSIIANLRNPG